MSTEFLKMMGVDLRLGDCLEVMRGMPDASVDSIVTDPPYELGFMGKGWDKSGIANSVEMWREALRVLKPGGHLLAFSGTRTYHRMTCAIEDAGFEVRDQIGWLYGCLDESTEVVTERGVMPYHKAKVGDRALCYDVEHGEYTYQPILEIVEYDYSDTAYRLVGDFGEQVVSRNHRVIVERGGSEAFQLAETLQREACVPVLESLSALRQALYDARSSTSGQEQNVQPSLQGFADRCLQRGGDAIGPAQRRDDQVRVLRSECMEAGGVAAQGDCSYVQSEMQRGSTRRGVGEARAQGAGALVGRVGGSAESAHDGRIQPSMGGWADVPQPERGLRRSADQVRAMPCGSDEHGEVRWLCDGAPAGGGAGNRPTADASGVCASHQPQCDGQPTGEPDAVCDERRPQGVRAWGGHRSTVVRVVPFHYTGKVWCLRVPTGAFVAVRGGVAFPTGNSGFPKSLDVSKAIDKAAGAERVRVMVPTKPGNVATRSSSATDMQSGFTDMSEPVTDAARQWQGWGTALKPAWEPITVARKPLIGTVASNVLAHGTGAINVDGCRVAGEHTYTPRLTANSNLNDDRWQKIGQAAESVTVPGRWPANLIHDGSDEVLAAFPQAPGQMADVSTTAPSPKTSNVYGKMRREGEPSANSDNDGAVGFKMKPGMRRLDAGSAARFFQTCKSEYDSSLWQDLLRNQSDATTAGQNSSPQKPAVAFALELAVKKALPEGLSWGVSLSVLPTMSETPTQFEKLAESLTQAIQSIDSRFWLGSKPARLSLSFSPVKIVVTQEPTGITTITASHWTSDGSAAPVTFNITPMNSEVGAKDFEQFMAAENARFRYCAKASKSDRSEGNNHPTVKPTELMRYLCRLVTPPGGVVLDPFMGSGSTGKAAVLEGFRFTGIDMTPEYLPIAEARILAAVGQL